VDGEALIGALEIWESMVGSKLKTSLTYRLAARTYPKLGERKAAIREASLRSPVQS
jgi:hypothetical protein